MGGLTHVALFTWTPGTTEAQIRELTDALNALPALIPEIRSFRAGPDAGVREGNDQFAVVVEFDDLEAYGRYAADPRHLDVIERFLKPILATRHAVQVPHVTSMGISGAREKLADAVETAQTEPVFLERYGRPAAVLVSAERYGELLDASEDVEDVVAFDAAMADEGANIPWDQVKADLGWT